MKKAKTNADDICGFREFVRPLNRDFAGGYCVGYQHRIICCSVLT